MMFGRSTSCLMALIRPLTIKICGWPHLNLPDRTPLLILVVKILISGLQIIFALVLMCQQPLVLLGFGITVRQPHAVLMNMKLLLMTSRFTEDLLREHLIHSKAGNKRVAQIFRPLLSLPVIQSVSIGLKIWYILNFLYK